MHVDGLRCFQFVFKITGLSTKAIAIVGPARCFALRFGYYLTRQRVFFLQETVYFGRRCRIQAFFCQTPAYIGLTVMTAMTSTTPFPSDDATWYKLQ
jgi:hypothetical protein